MNLLSWNCRGLGNPLAIQFLMGLVYQRRPNVIFLCETKADARRLEQVRVKLRFDNCFVVDADEGRGGLALLWNSGIDVEVRGYSNHYIDSIVTGKEGFTRWRLTGYYGNPEWSRRRESWNLLRYLSSINNLPWALFGDFNDIIGDWEKEGRVPHPRWLLRGFGEAVNESGLFDFGFGGCQFTWERGRGTDRWVREKLDRVLVSDGWRDMFLRVSARSLDGSTSDHLPIFLTVDVGNQFSYTRKPRYENCWERNPDCSGVVEREWLRSQGLPMGERLRECSREVWNWGKKQKAGEREAIRYCQGEMGRLRDRRDEASVRKFGECQKRYFDILRDQSDSLQQRAKELWRNRIRGLRNEAGVFFDEPHKMGGIMVNYFSNLFTSAQGDMGPVLTCLTRRFDDNQNDMLLRTVTAEEVKGALFAMHPGPDGLSSGFFQTHWSTIGPEVVSLCHLFMITGSLPDYINDTHIVLILKCKSPDQMSDFRPIALCNVVYRILAKVLATRLRGSSENGLSGFDKGVCDYSALFYSGGGKGVGACDTGEGFEAGGPVITVPFHFGSGMFECHVESSGGGGDVAWAEGSKGFEAEVLHDVLTDYGRASGQEVNVGKTSIVFGRNVHQEDKEAVCESLGIREQLGHGKYLGLPGYVGRKKREILGFVRERLRARGLSEEIERIMNSFWWGCERRKRGGIRWSQWKDLCVPKQFGGMGFRRVREMNLAMLDKQGWNFLNKPEALVTKIFKARYFPNCSFLEGDPWLPSDTKPYVESLPIEYLGNPTVNSLICVNSREWDREVLDDIFCERDVNLIQSIPLANEWACDSLYWQGEQNGVYSVRSAYRIAVGNMGEGEGVIWKGLWRLKIPPKVKCFFWNLCTMCLPTKDALVIKRVQCDPICVMCGRANESSIHLFANCDFAHACWNHLNAEWIMCYADSVAIWIEEMWTVLPVKMLEQVVMVTWAIWEARNALVWQQKNSNSRAIVQAALIYARNWKEAREKDDLIMRRSLQGSPGELPRWVPHEGVRVNIDVAMDMNNCRMGFGWSAQDGEGRLLGVVMFVQKGLFLVKEAEAMGAREALSWIKEMGWNRVILETDSQVVTNAVSGDVNLSPFGSIM
ncbi:PREDICTED: uncharacterized protein LOC109156272 [Ipomoea nil]|uniref:uncharacterized protein LOC109156272 n=1 Tax=Ipomoea nil TaxID=35883 RepID=UPI000900B3FD|nr:PREDICTED: uncharacterized protein LOC109156272 [Ipomoea nil]